MLTVLLATGANRLWHCRLLVRLNFRLYLHCFNMRAVAARNFPSQQAFITRQCNKQRSRGSDRAACWHSLAAPVIKPNDGKRQDTITAQTWKIKLCNESTDVICTPTTEEGWGGGRGKIETEGESFFSQIDRERWKKCVNIAGVVPSRSVSVGITKNVSHFFFWLRFI